MEPAPVARGAGKFARPRTAYLCETRKTRDAREDTNETPGIIINRCDDDKSAIAERYCIIGDTAFFFVLFFFWPPF